MSRSSAEEVSTTTGMVRVRGSPFTRRRTSSPSTRGSFRSRRITLGGSSTRRPSYRPSPNTYSRASAPSRTTCMWFARWLSRNACSVSSMSFGLSSTSRISIGPRITGSVIGGFALEAEQERRARAGLRLRPHPPAVPLHDPLDDGEADPGPLILLGPVHPLEHPEQLVRVAHVESDAVVFDEIHPVPLQLPGPDLDHGGRTGSGELERVGQKVHVDLLEEGGIRLARRELVDANVHPPPFELGVELPQGAARHVRRVDLPLDQRLPAQAGEGQKVVDQPAHLLRALPNDLEVVAGGLRHGGAVVLQHNAGEPIDGPEWGAEVVGDAVGERFQLAVRRL